jgi:hypothetical protein
MGKHDRWVEDDGTVNWPEKDEDEARNSLKEIEGISRPRPETGPIAEASLSHIDTW